MSESQVSEVVTPAATAPVAPPAPVPFAIPDGYTLVPTQVYQDLLDHRKASEVVPEADRCYRLQVIRQMMIGKPKANFTPGDEVIYKPGEYFIHLGTKYTDLQSFRTIWDLQFRPQRNKQPKATFRILNPLEMPDPRGVATPTQRLSAKAQRMAQMGDAAYAGNPGMRRAPVPTEQMISDMERGITTPSQNVRQALPQGQRSRIQLKPNSQGSQGAFDMGPPSTNIPITQTSQRTVNSGLGSGTVRVEDGHVLKD